MRFEWSRILIMVLLFLGTNGFAGAQNELRFRHIYVPADAPETWPEGDWVPISASRIETIQQSANTSVNSAWMREAFYEATLDRETLRNGRLKASISPSHSGSPNRASSDTLFDWKGCNLAISDLTWGEQPASLGNNPEGNPYLLIPSGVTELQGTWSARGRALDQGAFFDLSLPPSAVTELTLKIPESARLKVFDSILSTQLPPDQPGYRRIRLSLGSSMRVRFFVDYSIDSTESQSSSLLTRSETLLLMGRDQSRVRQELLVEVLGGEIRSLRVPVPDIVEISSVDWGGVSLNSWNVSQKSPRILTIDFPESFSGISRPIRLTGTIAKLGTELWRVPRLLPVSSHPISELVTLNVNPPLELLTIKADGFRQTAASTNADGAGSFAFQRSSPAGEIDIRVGPPPNRLRTEIVSRVMPQDGDLLADVELSGYLSSGRMYSFWFQLAKGWDPVEVRFLDRNSMRVSPELPWSIETRNERRTLRVELPKAINREQPLQLSLKFRSIPDSTQASEFPVIRVPGEIPSDQWLVFAREDLQNNRLADFQREWKQLLQEEFPVWESKFLSMTSWNVSFDDDTVWHSAKPSFQMFPGLLASLMVTEDFQPDMPQAEASQQNDASANETKRKAPNAARFLDSRLKTELISPESQFLTHRWEFQIPETLDSVELIVPESIPEFSVLVDGTPARMLDRGDRHYRFSWPSHKSSGMFSFFYQTPIVWGRDRFVEAVPLPQMEGWSLSCSWELELPSGCRLHSYHSDLQLLTQRAEIHWSQRLFGALGRSHDQGFFDPLVNTTWALSKIEGDLGSNKSSSNLFLFKNGEETGEFQINVWSENRARNGAWLLFSLSLLSGVLVRISRFGGRSFFAAILLCLLIVTSIVATERIAFYSGSMTAGICVAILCPRLFLMGRRRLTETPTEFETEIPRSHFRELTTALLLLGVFLGDWQGVFGQNANTSRTIGMTFVDLLIPYSGDTPTEELPELIYVRGQHRSLFPATRVTRPILITSADYQCQISTENATSLKAVYHLEVPKTPVRDFITVPLGGANLSRENGCLINGEPVAVSINQNGQLEIPLAAELFFSKQDASLPIRAPRPDRQDLSQEETISLVVEFNLYPIVSVSSQKSRIQLTVPPVTNSQLRCRHSSDASNLRFLGMTGQTTLLDGGEFSAQLGKTQTLSMEWNGVEGSSPIVPLRETPDLQMESQIAVEVLSSYLNYRFRVSHELQSGELSTIRWNLPKTFQFRKLVNENILQTRLQDEEDHQVLLIDLKQPLRSDREPLLLEAEFIVPMPPDEEDEIIVEIPELTPQQENVEDEPFAEVRDRSMLVGIWAPPELPLSILELPSTEVQSATSDEFISAWPEDASLQVPLFVYRVNGATSFGFLKTNSKPQKQVWVKELGTVGEEFLDWEWQGEVQTSVLPAFEHEFLLDPRLEVLSVSVKEDQAERVNRWSRDGNRLIVRLTRKTEESSQNVQILTRLPLMDSTIADGDSLELELPEIQLLGAERMEDVVELSHVVTRTLKWKESVDISASTTIETGPNVDQIVSFDLFSRQREDVPPRILLISLQEPRPYLFRHLMLKQRADGAYDVELMFRENQVPNLAGTIIYRVPKEWVSRLKFVDADGHPMELSMEETEMGELRVSLPPELRGRKVLVRSTLVSPNDDLWLFPLPVLEGDASYQTQVSLSLSEGWGPRVECRVPADKPLVLKSFPEHLESWDYLCDQLELQRTELSDPQAVPQFPLVISHYDVRPEKTLRGKWWLHYRGRGKEVLELELPTSVSVLSVTDGAEALPWTLLEEQRTLEVSIDPGVISQEILINWESKQSATSSLLMESELPIPVCRGIPIEAHQLVLVSNPQIKMAMHHGLVPEEPYETQLKILELYLRKLKNQELTVPQLPASLRSLLMGLKKDLETEFSESESTPSETSSRVKRWEKVLSECNEYLAISEESEGSVQLGESQVIDYSELLPGLLPSSARPDLQIVYAEVVPEQKAIKLWWVSRMWSLGFLLGGGALLMVPLLVWVFREPRTDWIAQHRVYVWMLIGAIWWTCLSLSFLGLVVLILAIACWLLSGLFPRLCRL